MKIANIVYDGKLVNHTPVDFVNYYDKPVGLHEIDNTLPTLYVGWRMMKSVNSDNEIILNSDILSKRIISDELYWEFSFDEHKAHHVSGVDDFIKNVPEYYLKPKYKYINLDPVFFQIVDVDELMCILSKNIHATYNYKNEMLYLLTDNNIVGIDLKMYNFFKFNIDDIMNRVYDRCQNKSNIFNDIDGSIHKDFYKKFPNFTLLKRYIITFLTK